MRSCTVTIPVIRHVAQMQVTARNCCMKFDDAQVRRSTHTGSVQPRAYTTSSHGLAPLYLTHAVLPYNQWRGFLRPTDKSYYRPSIVERSKPTYTQRHTL